MSTLADGSYVVTYSAEDNGGETSVFVQKFNADGTTSGAEVKLTGGEGSLDFSESQAEITSFSDGSYMVTYSGEDNGAQRSIYMQKFNSDGTVAGDVVKIDGHNSETAPDVTSFEDGSYVVTYVGQDNGSETSIFVQKFNADGTPSGNEAKIGSNDEYSESAPQVTTLSDGSYVVTYVAEDNYTRTSVYTQKFNSDGTVDGDPVKLPNSGDLYSEYDPQIVALGDGSYVVAYVSEFQYGSYINVQKFNADGTPDGDVTRLQGRTDTYRDSTEPELIVLEDGSYVVSYTSQDYILSGGTYDTSIYVQRFNPDGSLQASTDTVVANSAVDGEGSESVTYSVDNTTYYTIDENGTVTLTQAGADIVNSGGDLPNFTVTAINSFGGDTLSSFIDPETGMAVDNANSPTITIEDTTVLEDISQIIGNVSDIDGTIDSSSLSADNGTLSIDTNGNIIYTPNANFSGTDNISISVTDNDGLTTTQATTVTVDAVADKPIISASIENGTLLSVSEETPFSAVDNFTDNSDWTGVGFSSASGGELGLGMDSTSDEYAYKTFSFGAENANQTVTISFDATSYGWDSDDNLIVKINDSEAYSKLGYSSTHSFTGTTDENGNLKIEFRAQSGSSDGLGIDNLVISGTTQTVPNTYEYDFNITNSLVDSSETLSSVTVSGLPSGATLSAGTDNGDGTWSVAQNELSGLKIISTVLLDSTDNIDVSVSSIDGSDLAVTSADVSISTIVSGTETVNSVNFSDIDTFNTTNLEASGWSDYDISNDNDGLAIYNNHMDLGYGTSNAVSTSKTFSSNDLDKLAGETVTFQFDVIEANGLESFQINGTYINITSTGTYTIDLPVNADGTLDVTITTDTLYSNSYINLDNIVLKADVYESPFIIPNDGSSSIVLDGIADGTWLSAGTKNADGTWTLQQSELTDLTIKSTSPISDAITNISVVDTSIQTGTLVDGIVEGAYYETSSGISGYTDENGNFSFKEGDSVIFSVGGVTLGVATAEDIASGQTFLQDIADVDRTDLNDEYLENMAVFLQSIDTADSGDNIVITQAMRDALADVTIDLRTATEEEVKDLIESIGGNYVDESAAMTHVQEMLEEYAGIDSNEFDEHIDDSLENAILGNEPQAGIEYTTSSGLTGITGIDGKFEYNSGDEVTFSKDGEILSTIDSRAIGNDSLITFNELEVLNHTEIDFDNLELNFDNLSEILDSNDNTVYTNEDEIENLDLSDMLHADDSNSLSELLGESNSPSIEDNDSSQLEDSSNKIEEDEYCPFKALEENSDNLIANIEFDDTLNPDDQ